LRGRINGNSLFVRQMTLDEWSESRDSSLHRKRNAIVHGGNMSTDIELLQNPHINRLRWMSAFQELEAYRVAPDETRKYPLIPPMSTVLDRHASAYHLIAWKAEGTRRKDFLALADDIVTGWLENEGAWEENSQNLGCSMMPTTASLPSLIRRASTEFYR
jgi:hypothetical protein